MKKLIMIMTLLFITAQTIHAQQIRINNLTTCDIMVDVYVWAVPCSTAATAGPYIAQLIPFGQFATFAGVSNTDEYQVQIIADAAPGGTNYPMPLLSAGGTCDPSTVDTAPFAACTNIVTASITTVGPNYVLDVTN